MSPIELPPIIPQHIGIIMDGNGQWAKKRSRPRIFGHKNGVKAVRTAVETCAELKIKALTLYAFSTENWARPSKEVAFLMKLFQEFLKKEVKTMMDNDVKLRVLGKRDDKIPSFVLDSIDYALDKTSKNQGLNLCLAFNYGAKEEIIQAVKTISSRVKEGVLEVDEITEDLFDRHLYTAGLPELDLLIRTSSQIRISNFLLWQLAYAELYFTDVLWPDFDREELIKAMHVFSTRIRKMGKVVE